MSVNVDVQIATRVSSVPTEAEIRSWMSHAVDAVRSSDADYDIAVRVVDEDEGRELNRRFRNKDNATNVLSFPAGDEAAIADPASQLLGDIVICGPVVEREAEEQGKDPASHWGHLLVHGTLHLLGFDHQTEGEAEEMEAMERRLLAMRGIEDPYTVE